MIENRGTVCYIDDDKSTHALFNRSFKSAGLTSWFFSSRELALEWMEKKQNKADGQIDVDWIICDVNMPGMSFENFIFTIERLELGERLCFASGNPDSEDANKIRSMGYKVHDKLELLRSQMNVFPIQ